MLFGFHKDNHSFRFIKKYDAYHNLSKSHFTAYIADVKSRTFPGDEHIFKIKHDAFESFLSLTSACSPA